MAYGLKIHESNIYAGLGTCTYTVQVAGVYFVSCQTTTVPPSGLVTTIQQNGTTMSTSTSTDPSEKTVGVTALLGCAVGDVITVVLTSSATNDQLLNTLKSTIVLTYQGI